MTGLRLNSNVVLLEVLRRYELQQTVKKAEGEQHGIERTNFFKILYKLTQILEKDSIDTGFDFKPYIQPKRSDIFNHVISYTRAGGLVRETPALTYYLTEEGRDWIDSANDSEIKIILDRTIDSVLAS